ncbi:MAG TPA: hypothetical protein VJU59_40355 [Paraburkholderia sp.]|uniref:hypothetical protein n=1 Tax=Paraburkholderia sp. TaxID=1926495 RepID=UPI002B4598E6|nr:hypothetical protein [Paraburkholderia sp.]HKR45852.1 hypothetical protein [Paraburkholderia sp.]
MIDPEEFGKAMGALIKEATAPLLQRIGELEKQLAEQYVPSAQDIVDQISLEKVATMAAAMLPIPENGKSVTIEDVRPMLDEMIKAPPTAAEVAALIDLDALAKSAATLVPAPQNGTSVTVEDVAPMLADLVKALPPAEPGKDADMDELRAIVKAMEPPAPLPAPTVDEVAATFERRFSDLTLSWERQARDTFDKAADRMPKPADGRDAIPLEGFDLALADDGRTVTVKMQAGDTVLEKSVKIASVLDCGIFKHDGIYEKGDGVSYGGSFWIAKCDNPQGVPGTGETDWRCSVKAGRPGKDLRDNASTFDPSKGVKL